MGDFEKSPRLRRKAGLERIAGLLDALRAFGELREGRPGNFQLGSKPFLHFHYHPDGTITGDVRLSGGGFTAFDVSDEDGQQEFLAVVESRLGE